MPSLAWSLADDAAGEDALIRQKEEQLNVDNIPYLLIVSAKLTKNGLQSQDQKKVANSSVRKENIYCLKLKLDLQR